LRNACDTAPGLNCFKAAEQGARSNQRDEEIHNAEDENRRKDLVAGQFVRQTHEDDGLEHAEAAGNMADDTRRQRDDENRKDMQIAGGSGVRKTHVKDSAGKGQIRQRQTDLREGNDRSRYLQSETEELEALHPPPERGIRDCERESRGPKSNARLFRQPYSR
jgi:hypothetical protein